MTHQNNKGNVLFIDDDVPFLKTRALFLERAGFTVFQAETITKAKRLLDQHWIHLLIIDVRLEDSNDIRDKSGIEFAKWESIRAIPKIIITAYPSYDASRETMSPLDDEPLAVAYLDKEEPAAEMVRLANRAIERQQAQYGSAVLNWHGTSAIQLADNLAQDDSDEYLAERAHELEMAIKATFHLGYSQINLMPLLIEHANTEHLIVHAVPEHARPRLFLVYVSADAKAIHHIAAQHDIVFPGVPVASTAFTTRYAVFSRPVPGFNNDLTMQTFSDVVNFYATEFVCQALRSTLHEQLFRLHGQIVQHEIRLSQSFNLGTFTEFQQRLQALSKRAQLFGLTKIASFTPLLNEDRWNRWVHDEPRQLPVGILHNNLQGNTIVYNAEHRGWLIDFSRVAVTQPLILDYIRLSVRLRHEWSTAFHSDAWEVFEQSLVDEDQIDDPMFVQRFTKQAAVLQTILDVALQETGCSVELFQQAIIWSFIESIQRFDATQSYGLDEIKQFAHAAISLTLHGQNLQNQQQKPSLLIDFDEAQSRLIFADVVTELTPSECELFAYFYERRNETLARIEIAKEVYNAKFEDTDMDDAKLIEYQRINTMVGRLRTKIASNPNAPNELIKTVRNKGYVLNWDGN